MTSAIEKREEKSIQIFAWLMVTAFTVSFEAIPVSYLHSLH
jgi:hypothetical protein